MQVKLEVRSNSITLEGYVNVPERKSRVMPSIRGKFTESIAGGAFKRAIEKAEEIKILLNHDSKRELGSTKSNLELKEDEIGLYAKAEVFDDEVRQLAIDKKLTGWSFGFKVNKDKWIDTDEGIQHRTVEDLDLFEVSILSVTPAYYATKVESRGAEENLIEHRATDEISIEMKEEDVELTEGPAVEAANDSESEERLLLCHKHYVDTVLRIAKEREEF